MHLLHISLFVSDLQQAKAFYSDILGLKLDDRPDLGFPGLFYKLGQSQQLHLLLIHDPYRHAIRPQHGGRDRHVALACKDLPSICERLEQANIAFTRSKSGRAAIFCHDADQNVIELIAV